MNTELKNHVQAGCLKSFSQCITVQDAGNHSGGILLGCTLKEPVMIQ